MPPLATLDDLTVDVLMDNYTDSYSSKPSHVVSEFNNVIDAGAHEISGRTLCCAQLGLSLMLTATANGKRHKMLFDAGPEGAPLIRNAKNLGVKWDDVEQIAISHGHWDHMGALTAVLDEMSAVGNKRVPCHVNPGMFVERGARLTTGRIVPFEKVPSVDELNNHGAEVVNEPDDRTLLEDMFYLSAEIPRITEFEKGRQDHLCKNANDTWQPDPFLMDERYLAAHIKNKGLILFSSCSHAGIVNVLHSARATFKDIPIYGVFGGFHLVGSLEAIIPETIENMKAFSLQQIVPAHCTGWRAVRALVNAFGEDIVVPSAVGSRYKF